jgi:hypothetical protein
MASKSMETKNLQKTKFLQETETRQALLKEKGVSDKDIAKDPKIKRLKARIKQVGKAVARINFLEAQTEQLKVKKEQRLAEEAAARAEAITTERRSKKKVVEEKAPEPKKKGGGKAPAKGGAKPDQKKKGK